MSDEIRLWRDSLGSFVRDSVFGQATHIALPAAKHAALMRVVEAARALLDLLAYEHPDFGYSEIADLRAALALPADAAGSAEAVRAACSAVPALEEAMRRRLRWADEVHSQILAVPVPAQTATEGAGEAVKGARVGVRASRCGHRDCVDGVLFRSGKGGVHGGCPVPCAKCAEIDAAHPTPRAEAASVVPAGMECGCCGAKAGRPHSETGCCSRHEDGPRLFARSMEKPAQAGEAVALLPWQMFCYVCGEPAACIGYECGEGPGAHTLNGCCNDHCGHGNESEKCVPIGAHPTPRAEAYVEWCARHANIEKVPGPFCPACAYASVMRDGVKMGRESAPRAQPAPEGAGEAVAWEATGRYGGAPATEYGDSEENARMIYRSRYGAAPDSVRPLVYASPSRPGGAA